MFLQNLKREREEFVGLRDITVICEDADLCQRFAEQPLKEGDKLKVIHCVPGGDRDTLPAQTVTDLAAVPALLGIKVKPKDLRATIARNHRLAGVLDFDYP